MPIKGLSDRGEAFPVIGEIRKGAKKTENAPGKELPYFRVEFAEGENETAEMFYQIFGREPKIIQVLFPFNEVERFWDPWKTAHTAGRTVAKSDGEYIKFQLDKHGEFIVRDWLDKDGRRVPHPADNIAGYDYQNKPVMFKDTGLLRVIVPKLLRAACLRLVTTSIHDIANLSDQIAAFQNINNGILKGIPFILKRVPKMISGPKSAKDPTRVRRLHYMCNLEVDPAWAKSKFLQLEQMAQPELLSLPPGEEIIIAEDEDEQAGFEDLKRDEAMLPDKIIINPMDEKPVEFAAKTWNIDNTQAAQEIGRAALGDKMDKEEFKAWVKSKA